MHTGPIALPPLIKQYCFDLVDIGISLGVFTISSYIEAMDICDKISEDSTRVHDLQQIIRLCNVILDCDIDHDILRSNINGLIDAINMIVLDASIPMRSCGMHAKKIS